jgi:hypothetical protein
MKMVLIVVDIKGKTPREIEESLRKYNELKKQLGLSPSPQPIFSKRICGRRKYELQK